MIRRPATRKAVAMLPLLAALSFPAFGDELLSKAKQLLDGGKPAEAYALLAPEQTKRSDNPDYNYLFGIAAVDSGNPNDAIFAFERYLAARPNDGGARLELARALYAAGETAASRAEFESVKKASPPKDVQVAIDRYLSAINRIAADKGTRVSGFAEVTVGHDSNVNSATGQSTVAIPLFGGLLVNLSPGSRSQSDGFTRISAGVNLDHNVSAETGLRASLAGAKRMNHDVNGFDQTDFDGSVGLVLTRGIDRYTVDAQAQKTYYNHNALRTTYGVLGQWQRDLADSSQITAFGQISRINYTTQSIRDVNRYMLGAGYAAPLGRPGSVWYVSVYGASEVERSGGLAFLGHRAYGARAALQLGLSPEWFLLGNASAEYRSYGGNEPFFLRGREDTQTDVGLGLLYRPAPAWQFRAQAAYTRNRSTIPLYAYKKRVISLTTRYDY